MDDGISRDANGYDYSGYPASRLARVQKIANISWPLRDDKGRHARGINDQPVDKHIPVNVRLEFEHDGETVLPGLATRWNRSHVFVIVSDPRVEGQQVWVKAEDVRRQ